ncbi:CHASE domain-containing protein [Pseudocolwellia sp. AS88]|uniref:CHASE domain-containing protein n=1 Tax=Pseudocolwellia sp. AS88 TaxID=3063958 RepID=UPI0026EABA7E|nr:CHASE domain-containing protein [Pseudocolwellia sp. AS88]MDO7083299.1 CHASE domain-containing protein [Pseudocolwellia sp. AS88]
MNKTNLKKEASNKVIIFRTVVGYSIGLLSLLMLLSAFIIIPKINTLFEEQYDKDTKRELKKEVALFNNFIESQRRVIEDLAKFPSITNAVMLSDADNASVNGLLKNVVIGGEKGRLVLQDIEANVLVQTTKQLQGIYTNEEPWIEEILNASKPYHFQLLNQSQDSILFKISVPVLYSGFVEGILTGEIKASLDDVFVNQVLSSDTAITLTQNELTVGTSTNKIVLARENTAMLQGLNVTFTYITDDAPLLKRERSVQNLIFSVLLAGLAVSFILFSLLSYTGALQRVKLKSKENSRVSLYSMPIIVGVLGVSASIITFIIVSNAKQVSVENNLIFESQKHVQEVRENLNTYLGILDSVNAFFSASEEVERQDFKVFVESFLVQHKSIKAIEWIPSITHEERLVLEDKARLEGFTNFSINEVNQDGNLASATQREHYLPVYYLEPIAGNENALGFDLASNPLELKTLIKAQESESKVATSKITLFEEDITKAGIFIFRPVFYNDKKQVTEKLKLQGFTSISLRVEDLVNEVLLGMDSNLALFIQDISDPEFPETLYGTPQVVESFSRDEIINLAGRSWRIKIYSKANKTEYAQSAWGMLITGLIFSGIIVLGLVHLIRRREYVEQLVVQRTAELTASEEHHRAIVELAVDGLITIDKFGIIERFNEAAENIFGYPSKEVIGSNIKILMPTSSHQGSDDYFKNKQDETKEQIISIERYLGSGKYAKGQHKNGTIFPIEVSVSEIKLGSTIKYSGIVRDISDRVAFEKEREQFIEKLTDSNEELERFAFVCSHDLQEPLRMIRSFSEKLQDHIKEDLEHDEKGKKYFNFVIDGAIRAQALINDILTYSSISNDIKQLEDVNIQDLINVIKKNSLDLTESNTAEITYDPLPNLQGNKTQLFQLFQNLINNGIKYQKTDTKAHVHISAKEAEDHWCFTIKDNGIGMDERHFKKIFEVFQRLHRRSQYAGTGVGLSICKKVVERHGGTIWVESEKGMGSTFYFTLLKA